MYYVFSNEVLGWHALPRMLMTFSRVREQVQVSNIHFYFRKAGGKKCLDVGCGDGMFAQRLKLWGFDVTGCEWDPIAAGRAISGGINVITKDFMKAEFPESYFDVVTMNHVLEHFSNPQAAVHKARKILKDGGRLIVVVPNASALSRFVFREFWFNWEIPRHLFHFTSDTLKNLTMNEGFETVVIEDRSHTSIWLDSLRYVTHQLPMNESEALVFRRRNLDLCRRFEQYLDENHLGDHIAGCFQKKN